MDLELNTPTSVEVAVESAIDEIDNLVVSIDGTDALDVTFDSNEFSIVGDDMVVVTKYDDAPQWLKDTIDNIVNIKTAVAVGNLNTVKEALDVMLGELDIAKNTYQLSIISSDDINQRITTAITSLNSALRDADATILDIANTAVTPSEASAIALNTLSASLSSNGEIGSAIHNLQTAMTTLQGTTAESISYLESTMQGEVEGNAQAMHVIRTYVGIDDNGVANNTGLLSDVKILQKQNDGVIETVTGTYDVMLNPQDPNLAELVVTAEPYASWKAADVTGMDTRLNHIGDVYIKYSTTSNGAKEYIGSYKFIRTVVDNSDAHRSTDADGFTWALIIDQAAQDAYQQSLNAYDLADNKRRVFTITPSGPYDEGDLWVRVVNGSNQVWKCQVTREQLDYYNATDWSIASTDDTATVALQTGLADGTVTVKLTNAYVGTTPFLTYITNEIDSKVGVYSGETAPVAGQPSGVAANDIYLWFTTASKVLANGTTQVYDITRTYKYSGTVWNEITTDSNIVALADWADGKRTIFSGNTVPVGSVDRDIWIPSADVSISTSAMCSVANGTWNGTSCSVSKYYQGEVYQFSATGKWIVATKYTANLEAVRTNLQGQLDGKVDTYYQGTVPVGMTALNNGDYWYCTTDVSTYKKGKVYKYVHATTSWVETADVSRYAFDIADGKAAIFTSTNAPTTGYKVNDMLIVIGSFNNGTTTFADGVVLSSTTNRVSGFTPSDWVKKINDTEDLDAFVSVTYTPTVTSLQNQIDGKIESWYTLSTNDPKTAWADAPTRVKHDGDMWYQTDTKRSYWYSSSTNNWNLIDDAKAIQALADAATAQATADGKISSYYMNTLAAANVMSNAWTATEKANNVGDLVVVWNDSTLDNNGTWRWNGTSWVTTRDKKLIALANDVTNLSTELSNGTNTWAGADSTLENSLRTEITDEGARVESKFAYNSNVNINGVWKKSGFGLTTNYTSGSGTEVDPYISEFWIDASRFKFTNSNQTGQVAPFTIDASGATPQITFNGKVSFSNVTNAPVTNRTYVQASQPATGMITGDTWIDTDDNNSLYTYNGSSWIKTQSGSKTYLQITAPATGMVAGDIWVDSDDNYKQYRYSGSAWVALAYNPATAINAGATTIDGGKITTESITASQINVTDLFSKNITYTGVITGGDVAGGGIIQSYNGKMKIDLVNGSIYIA